MGWEQDRSDGNLYECRITSYTDWTVAAAAITFDNPGDYYTMSDWVEGATHTNPKMLEARIKQCRVRVVGHPWVPATLAVP